MENLLDWLFENGGTLIENSAGIQSVRVDDWMFHPMRGWVAAAPFLAAWREIDVEEPSLSEAVWDALRRRKAQDEALQERAAQLEAAEAAAEAERAWQRRQPWVDNRSNSGALWWARSVPVGTPLPYGWNRAAVDRRLGQVWTAMSGDAEQLVRELEQFWDARGLGHLVGYARIQRPAA